MFSDNQPITEVTVSELARRASAVIQQAVDGERVIVTRNGRPTALIISIDDGIDVLLAGSEHFAALRRDAREAFVAPRAAAALACLPRRSRGMLDQALAVFMHRNEMPRGGLATVRTATHAAACELLGGDRLVVVYAIEPLADLRARLFGERLEREFRRRWGQAMLHGRSWHVADRAGRAGRSAQPFSFDRRTLNPPSIRSVGP